MSARAVFIDHYALLGLAQTATETEISTAYRRLALQLHPDKNKAADVPEKFEQAKKSRDVLLDQKAREAFDKLLDAKQAVKKRNSMMDEKRRYDHSFFFLSLSLFLGLVNPHCKSIPDIVVKSWSVSSFCYHRTMKEDLERREEDARRRSAPQGRHTAEEDEAAAAMKRYQAEVDRLRRDRNKRHKSSKLTKEDEEEILAATALFKSTKSESHPAHPGQHIPKVDPDPATRSTKSLFDKSSVTPAGSHEDWETLVLAKLRQAAAKQRELRNGLHQDDDDVVYMGQSEADTNPPMPPAYPPPPAPQFPPNNV